MYFSSILFNNQVFKNKKFDIKNGVMIFVEN